MHFSRAWELTATAGAPIVGLILLLLIQHTQNRDDRATQLKLNELVRATGDASDRLIGIEDSAAVDLVRLHEEYRQNVADPQQRSSERRLRMRVRRRAARGTPRQAVPRRPWKVVWSPAGAPSDRYDIVCSRHGTEVSARRAARSLVRRAEKTLPAEERRWRCSVVWANDPDAHA